MRIGVDLDEILSQFIKGFIKFHNHKYKTKLKQNDFITYNFWKVIKQDNKYITEEESIKRVNEFFQSKYLDSIKPVKGSIKGIDELIKQNHKLYILTTRPEISKERTLRWINKNYQNKFTKVFFIKYLTMTKVDICIKNKINIIIEDTLKNAVDCANKGINAILLDYVYNQGTLPKNVYRVESWSEINQKIKELTTNTKVKENA